MQQRLTRLSSVSIKTAHFIFSRTQTTTIIVIHLSRVTYVRELAGVKCLDKINNRRLNALNTHVQDCSLLGTVPGRAAKLNVGFKNNKFLKTTFICIIQEKCTVNSVY